MQWANENGGVLALLALLVALAAPVIGKLLTMHRDPELKSQLRDLDSRTDLIKRFNGRGADAYFGALAKILGLATRYYGPNPLSWRAYRTCLTVAVVYPLLAVMLGWVLFNVCAPGGIAMFADTSSDVERALRFAAFVVGMTFALFVGSNAENFSQFVVARLFNPLDTDNVRTGAFTFTFTFTFAVAVAADNETAALIFLLYALLPFLNAFADMLSLWITRGFLGKLVADRPNLWWILGQMVLDFALATVCLALLVGTLIGGLEVWAWVAPRSLPLDWRSYWTGVHEDPRTGVALYVMALTTLIPTIVHLVAGLGVVLAQKSRSYQMIAAELSAQPADQAFSETQVVRLRTQVERANARGYAGAVFVVAVVFVPLLWGAYAWIV